MTLDPAPALPVIRSLLGHGNLAVALKCFASLRRCHRPAFEFCLYDDGTLTEADRDQLRAELAPVTFVARADLDDAMDDRLARYPACRAYRHEQVYSAKILDVPLHSDGSCVFCDSDILFLRPFTGFERVRLACPQPVFTQDLWTTYSINPWELLNPWRVRLVERLNSGVMLVSTAQVDLDLLEWLLRRPRSFRFPHFEQTYWAALARRDGGKLLSPDQFAYPPYSGQSAPGTAVAWHFVGTFRPGFVALAAAAAADEATLNLPPVDLAIMQPETLTFPRFLRSRRDKRGWLAGQTQD